MMDNLLGALFIFWMIWIGYRLHIVSKKAEDLIESMKKDLEEEEQKRFLTTQKVINQFLDAEIKS